MFPKVTNTEKIISRWLSLSKKFVRFDNEKEEIFHSVRTHDYTNIIVIRNDGLIPLVRQYRPAIESHTIEFPGGLPDDNFSRGGNNERNV